MKIAQYKMGADNYVSIGEVTDWREDAKSSWIRISETIEVEFTPLAPEVIVPQELAQLDALEHKLIDEHLTKLNIIQTRRKDLLSLTAPTIVSSEVA